MSFSSHHNGGVDRLRDLWWSQFEEREKARRLAYQIYLLDAALDALEEPT